MLRLPILLPTYKRSILKKNNQTLASANKSDFIKKTKPTATHSSTTEKSEIFTTAKVTQVKDSAESEATKHNDSAHKADFVASREIVLDKNVKKILKPASDPKFTEAFREPAPQQRIVPESTLSVALQLQAESIENQNRSVREASTHDAEPASESIISTNMAAAHVEQVFLTSEKYKVEHDISVKESEPVVYERQETTGAVEDIELWQQIAVESVVGPEATETVYGEPAIVDKTVAAYYDELMSADVVEELYISIAQDVETITDSEDVIKSPDDKISFDDAGTSPGLFDGAIATEVMSLDDVTLGTGIVSDEVRLEKAITAEATDQAPIVDDDTEMSYESRTIETFNSLVSLMEQPVSTEEDSAEALAEDDLLQALSTLYRENNISESQVDASSFEPTETGTQSFLDTDDVELERQPAILDLSEQISSIEIGLADGQVKAPQEQLEVRLTQAISDLEKAFSVRDKDVFEKNDRIQISPEITEKVLVLLECMGYENPHEILVAHVKKFGIYHLFESLERLCQLHNENRPEIQAFSSTAQGSNDGIALRLSRLLLQFVMKKDFVSLDYAAIR